MDDRPMVVASIAFELGVGLSLEESERIVARLPGFLGIEEATIQELLRIRKLKTRRMRKTAQAKLFELRRSR